MEGKQKKYLDKVVDFLIGDTVIGERELKPPFTKYRYPSYIPNPFSSMDLLYFAEYCLNIFGLTEDEVIYVWDMYKSKIREITNN
jgi:hypothetical protein